MCVQLAGRRNLIWPVRVSQADSSTSREFGGTGLGLSIAHSIASLMSGRLSVVSPRQRPTAHDTAPLPKHHDVAIASLKPPAPEAVLTLLPCLAASGSILNQKPTADSDDVSQSQVAGQATSRLEHKNSRVDSGTSIDAKDARRLMAATSWSTIFTCLLPFGSCPDTLATGAAVSEQTIIKRLSAKDLQPMRAAFPILVVEDNVINQKLLSRILAQNGKCCFFRLRRMVAHQPITLFLAQASPRWKSPIMGKLRWTWWKAILRTFTVSSSWTAKW